MKNKWYAYFAVLALLLLLGTDKYIHQKYSLHLPAYFRYAQDFDERDQAILAQYPSLVYGGNINDPPLGMYYPENGQYLGLVVDHMSALSIELNKDIIAKPMVWDDALEALKNGETNLCDVIPSEERRKHYAFTDPIYTLTGAVMTQKDFQNQGNAFDWARVTVAVPKSDYALEVLAGKVPPQRIVQTKDIAEALELLEEGSVQAVAGDAPVLRYYLNELKHRDNYRIALDNLYRVPCALAVPKSQSDLVPVLNKAIFHLKQNHTIPKINSKWLASEVNSAYENTQRLKLILLFILALSFLVVYTIYMWNRSLQNLVDDKTRELKHTKNELEVTFNAIKNYIVMLDSQGRITNINQAYLSKLSQTLAQMLGQNYMALPIICEFERQYDGIIKKLLDKNYYNEIATFKPSYDFKTSKGIYRLRLYPLEYGPYVMVRMAIMIEDITTEKLNEAKLTQENKMSAIGQLAAGVAHELRNPLGIMRNSTFLLQDSWDDETLRTMALESIDSAIERSSGIIDNLLSFSRKNADQTEKTGLHQLVEEVFSFFAASLKDKKIQLINKTQAFTFETNQNSLRHILMNLIQNAADALGQEGRIEVSSALEPDNLLIFVRDNGPGIPSAHAAKIFEPFYTTKEVGKGTGLGLYIVYTETEKLGGEISVESEPQNTVFSLKLPLANGEKYEL